MSKASSNSCHHFRCVWPGMLKLPKVTRLLFLCNILRKNWARKLIYCMPISMKALYMKAFTMISMGMIKHSQSFQNSKFAMPLRYLKKNLEINLIFCKQITIKVSDKLISALLASKFSTRWYYHYRWTWWCILKALKVTSLQYFYNVSRRQLGMEFIFCVQIHIKVSTCWHYRLWWKMPGMSKVPKIGS